VPYRGSSDKIAKTRRKSDAILAHHFRQRARIFLLEQGEGPLVVLCHGWPELSYSWRHQIPAIAAAGFTAVASVSVPPLFRGRGGARVAEIEPGFTEPQAKTDIDGAGH
jgi:pimeloyl-ACP methyl ester carboxylesterase